MSYKLVTDSVTDKIKHSSHYSAAPVADVDGLGAAFPEQARGLLRANFRNLSATESYAQNQPGTKIPSKPLPSADILRSMFLYEPETGKLCWLVNPPRQKGFIGREAGTTSARNHNRRVVQIQRKMWMVHRVIWKMQTGADPGDCIDHANCDASDNRWCNLRQATRAENMRNKRTPRNSPLGIKCMYSRPDGRFDAFIYGSGKKRRIGTYETAALASAAYAAAAAEEYGEYARAS